MYIFIGTPAPWPTGVCRMIVFTQAAKMSDQWPAEIICTRSIIPTLSYNIITNNHKHPEIRNHYSKSLRIL